MTTCYLVVHIFSCDCLISCFLIYSYTNTLTYQKKSYTNTLIKKKERYIVILIHGQKFLGVFFFMIKSIKM